MKILFCAGGLAIDTLPSVGVAVLPHDLYPRHRLHVLLRRELHHRNRRQLAGISAPQAVQVHGDHGGCHVPSRVANDH